QPAITGTRPRTSATAALTTSPTSFGRSEKNSPVPPAAKKPEGSCSSSQATCLRYASASKRSSASKCVTGNDSRPRAIPAAMSEGFMPMCPSLPDKVQHDFPLRRPRAMFEQIDALPRPQHQPAVHDRHVELHLGQRRLEMRRHVVRALVVMFIEIVAFG